MKTMIKVAGTSFHPLPEGVTIAAEETWEEGDRGIPCAKAQVVLVREPENGVDPEAVKVMIKLTNGEAHHLGYLPKTEPLKTQVGDFTLATCVIKDYRSVGNYNPSYIITEVEGM